MSTLSGKWLVAELTTSLRSPSRPLHVAVRSVPGSWDAWTSRFHHIGDKCLDRGISISHHSPSLPTWNLQECTGHLPLPAFPLEAAEPSSYPGISLGSCLFLPPIQPILSLALPGVSGINASRPFSLPWPQTATAVCPLFPSTPVTKVCPYIHNQ